MRRGFWLITTEHLENRLWFKDDEDFRAGMNYVAVLAVSLDVDVLAYNLMSNHVHFVTECTWKEAHSFINEFKRLYSQYYSKKYQSRELLRRNGIDIRPLDDPESVEKGIAYTLMNPVAANICITPSGYPWGSGACYFNLSAAKGTPAHMYSGRARIKMLHSKKPVPASLLFDENGCVIPSSFINVKLVESIFRSAKRMDYFLWSSSKARLEKGLPAFRDQSILSVIPDLCKSIFRKNKLEELTKEELGKLLKEIRYRFSSEPKQIARVTSLPYETVSSLLDSM